MSEQDLIDRRVGHIRILARLGAGGMGTVWVGYDETLERRVAVKSLHWLGHPDSSRRARLLQEARLLSRVDHPNICGVHDFLQTPEGEFLVLELIDGETLERALERGLAPARRLEVAIAVAAALEAAHAEGIVHRDLKPANVMLAADGAVKVLDFGIARSEGRESPPGPDAPAGEARATETVSGYRSAAASGDGSPGSGDAVTAAGALVGTPYYLNPEQARGEPATPASDMYSFGLLLHELLTAEPPHDRSLPPPALVVRAARGETRAVAGAGRELAALISALESLGPGERPTATETRQRLERLRERPRRRLRRAFAATATAAVCLGAAKYTLDLRAERAERAAEAERANREAENARQVTDFLVGLFEVSDPESARGEEITARQLLDQGAARVRSELAAQPLVQARLLEPIGVVYTKLGLYESADANLRAALALRESATASPAEVAESLDHLGDLRYFQGRYEEAVALYERALGIREPELGRDHPDTATTVQDLADSLAELGRFDEAERLSRRALETRERVLGAEHRDVATTLHNLGMLRMRQGRNAEAEPFLLRDLAITEKLLGPDHPETGATLATLSTLLERLGRREEARAALERALDIRRRTLPAGHPRIAMLLSNLATALRHDGELERAESLAREALAALTHALGSAHPNVARVELGLARTLLARGDRAAGLRLFEAALRKLERAIGPDHLDLARPLEELGDVYAGAARGAEAAAAWRRALALRERHGETGEAVAALRAKLGTTTGPGPSADPKPADPALGRE